MGDDVRVPEVSVRTVSTDVILGDDTVFRLTSGVGRLRLRDVSGRLALACVYWLSRPIENLLGFQQLLWRDITNENY